MERLVYSMTVGDWVVENDGEIVDAMSWHDLSPATDEEAKAWFESRGFNRLERQLYLALDAFDSK